MPNDIYPLSVPVFLRGLTSLDHVLEKAATHVAEHKIEPAALLTARLFPDMFPLTRQVQIATDTAKRSAGRLAGIEPPGFDDVETTFEQLRERISKTSAFVTGITTDAFVGAAERVIEMKFGPSVISLTGTEYVTRFALPNFFFHTATAYDICRHNGVVLGKRDFLGSLES